MCVPGVGRGGGVGQVGAAPANQRGEADDEADDPDQADQQLRPDIEMYWIELQTIHCFSIKLCIVWFWYFTSMAMVVQVEVELLTCHHSWVSQRSPVFEVDIQKVVVDIL